MKVKFGISHEGMHVDQLLTNVALGYRPEGFIADQIMPIVTVMKQSDTYPIFSRADALRIVDTVRAPDTEAKRVRRSVSSGTYYCKNYALQYPATIEDKANADPIFMQKILNGRVEFIMDKMFLAWEDRAATLYTTTTNVGSSSAVSSAWTDEANSDPLGDINTAIDNIYDSTGKRPNRIIFGERAWRNVRRNTTIRNLIFGVNNGGGYVPREAVRNLLEIDTLLIGDAFKNSANEAQAESLAQIWADNVVLTYVSEAGNMDQPSAAYSFRWASNGLPNLAVERHPYDTKRKSESVEVGYYQDERIVGAEYAFLITATTSST